MPKIYVCVGMIASGKSSWCRAQADKGAIVICHDSITEGLHCRYRYEPGLRDFYRRVEESIAWAALSAGRDVVVDRTHLTLESRKRWINWAKPDVSSGVDYDGHPLEDVENPLRCIKVVAVRFPIRTPDAHAAERFNADPRGRSAEEWYSVARHHYEQAMKEPLTDGEGFDEIIDVPTMRFAAMPPMGGNPPNQPHANPQANPYIYSCSVCNWTGDNPFPITDFGGIKRLVCPQCYKANLGPFDVRRVAVADQPPMRAAQESTP